MAGIPWEIVFAVLGVVVPIVAALYEFVVVGRKRLGYRVQMDTTATDAVSSNHSGALQELRLGENGERLSAPSFVLLRIENTGATPIDTSDYAVLDDDKVGIRIRFPGRRVAGMVVTELSDDFLRPAFGADSGLSVRDDVIELPKVPLNRTAHYKVLAALDAAGGTPENFEDPEIVGGIKGGVGRGGIHETRSQTGTPRKALALIGFLVLLIIAQAAVSLGSGSAPLDCATGRLRVLGSTAFAPVLKEAPTPTAAPVPAPRSPSAPRGAPAGCRARPGRPRVTRTAGVLRRGEGRGLPAVAAAPYRLLAVHSRGQP
ncbi:hypothetical protein A8924_6901 [Saccharopolyspora erythraea NRRL 2338]|uniref:Phosphate binding protein (Secreted protein) n=2 Tax=Saccharopolyspora erythraea TaxID=1836 RepID=A4FNU4_SACEN|nr:hypothetical protein [Saccharopolyspora erythraea]EQD81965.1 phosphate-binding protein [Saccharopolyspora erythraea D]PFG99359.1 hypothetical protein A8924_6901 [Saccharopolyspora erythraea NRRL 2338]CAM05719.1 phosphate binding protein (secreted protein) [Saccharopolyspora erythraea NRRL 2338]